jgi:hypothetical protein
MKRHVAFARLKAIVLLVAAFSWLAMTEATSASLLRGRLVDAASRGVPGIEVTTFSTSLGRSRPRVSDGDGMYYLNIPPGAYILEIWVNPQQPIQYNITVRDPITDVPPVRVR